MSAPRVVAALPDPDFVASLPGCDFADAFAVSLSCPAPDAREVAAIAFSKLPDWAGWLLKLRNAAMARLGLKGAELKTGLPVLHEDAERVIVGLNDSHLDFRTLFRVDAESGSSNGSRILLVTIVRRHNALGRIYLAVIMPFHKLIVRSLLSRVARRLEAEAHASA